VQVEVYNTSKVKTQNAANKTWKWTTEQPGIIAEDLMIFIKEHSCHLMILTDFFYFRLKNENWKRGFWISGYIL
jgi:hypothetical protein